MSGQDWSAWGGQAPCCCTRGNSGQDATTAEMDCPRHGNPGYGPENFIPPCATCHGSGWIPGIAYAVGPLDELPCPCRRVEESRLLCCNPWGSVCICPPGCTCGYCGCRDRVVETRQPDSREAT